MSWPHCLATWHAECNCHATYLLYLNCLNTWCVLWSCHAIVQWTFNVQKNGVYTGNCEKAWMCVHQVSESIFVFIALSESFMLYYAIV